MVEALINDCNIPEEIKEVVLHLWMCYLSKLKVAFCKRPEDEDGNPAPPSPGVSDATNSSMPDWMPEWMLESPSNSKKDESETQSERSDGTLFAAARRYDKKKTSLVLYNPNQFLV